jgi:hypothetical protein
MQHNRKVSADSKLRSNRPNPKLQQKKVRQKSPDANINVSNELNVYKPTFIINNSFQPDAANTSINSLVKEISGEQNKHKK